MTREVIKCENEIKKAVWAIAEKYGFNDLGITGTIDPKCYPAHMKYPVPGLTIQFVAHVVK